MLKKNWMNGRLVTLGATIGCLALVGWLGVAAPAAGAAPPPPPQLSITVIDGQTQVRSNSDITYTTEVANHGSGPVTAELVLTTPAYVTIKQAPGAKRAARTATWRITVRPGQSLSRGATAHIGTIAKTDYRVTTLASLYQGKATSGIPLIRTAVANPIVGVTDPARTINGAPVHRVPTRGSSGTNWLLVAGAPGAAVVLAAATFVWWRRRRGGQGSSASPPSPLEVPAEVTAQPRAEPIARPVPERSAETSRPKPARPAPVASGRHHAVDSN